MKKMKSKILTTVLAIVTAAAISGCAANETKNAAAAGTSEVSAHETTAETTLAAASEQSEEKSTEKSVSDNNNAPYESEVDVSQLTAEESGNTETGKEDSPEEDKGSENADTGAGSPENEDPEDTGEDDPGDAESGEGSMPAAGKMSPIDNGTYPCSVVLVSTAENTAKEKVQELISKYDLGIVYDYGELNMYAFSVPEPMDKDTTKKFLDELMAYDFIISAEPDQIIYLDDPVMPYPDERGTIQ